MRRDKRDWIDVVRDKVREQSTEPQQGLWNRLETELSMSATVASATQDKLRRARILRYCSSAAAILLIGVVIATLIYSEQHSTNTPLAVVSAVVEPQPTETTTEPAQPVKEAIAPCKRLIINQSTEPITKEIIITEPENPITTQQSAEPVTPTVVESTTQKTEQPTSDKPRTSTNSRDVNNWPDEVFERKAGRDHKISVGVKAGGSLALSSSGTTSRMTMASEMLAPDAQGNLNVKKLYDNYTYKHSQPISFGLSMSKGFNYGLSIGLGVNYSLLRSKVSTSLQSKELVQTLQFVGIPLSVNWAFLQRERFSLYLGVEGEMEKCVKAKLGHENVKINPLQWSIHGVVGAQYQIGKHFAVYVEPKVSHYFTDTQLRTIRTDRNAHFNMQLGFRVTY